MTPPQLRKLNYQRHEKAMAGALKVAELYCQGVPSAEIAKRLGISLATVSASLARAKQIWQDRLGEAAELVKAESLAKLDKVEAEAWAAWQRSKKAAIERINKSGHTEKLGAKSEQQKKTTHRDGEAKYLDIVLRTIQQRLELLGIMKPESESLGSKSPLLEVIVSSRAEAAAMLTYGDFSTEVEVSTVEAGSVTEV